MELRRSSPSSPCRGIEVRLLGRARPDARRPDATLPRRRACATRSTSSASSRATPPSSSAAHARELASLGHEVLYVKLGRTARGRRGVRRGDPRGDRPRPARCASTRTRRGRSATAVERIRRLEPFGIDWVEQPVPAGNVQGLAHVRRVGRNEDRRRPGGVHDAAAAAGAARGGGRRRRPGRPRRRRAPPLPAAGDDPLHMASTSTCMRFMETELSFLANAAGRRDDPEPDRPATRRCTSCSPSG